MRLLAVVAASACGASAAPPPPPVPTVDVLTLQPAEVLDSTEYLARLRSRTAANIQPQIDGSVTKILVKPGDHVELNQPLMQVDPGSQPAAVAQAKASLQSKQAQLRLAEENLRRVKKLVAEGAVPGQELDNTTAAYESLKGDVDALAAQIKSSTVQLRYYTITAPGPGLVGDIPARVGDKVTPQTVLTTVTDNTVLEANVSVPVDRAHELTHQTRIDILDDTNHAIGTGTPKFISAQVNPETQSVLVKADIDNAKGQLRSDQIVRARVVWKVGQGLRVPALAVTRLGGQAFVYVAQPQDGKLIAKQRPVKLGDLLDNTYVVLEGVKAGEQVVTSNIQKLHDGAPIQAKG